MGIKTEQYIKSLPSKRTHPVIRMPTKAYLYNSENQSHWRWGICWHQLITTLLYSIGIHTSSLKYLTRTHLLAHSPGCSTYLIFNWLQTKKKVLRKFIMQFPWKPFDGATLLIINFKQRNRKKFPIYWKRLEGGI